MINSEQLNYDYENHPKYNVIDFFLKDEFGTYKFQKRYKDDEIAWIPADLDRYFLPEWIGFLLVGRSAEFGDFGVDSGDIVQERNKGKVKRRIRN